MTEIDKKLYKRDSKGKIREIWIYSASGSINQVSGLVDGKKVKHSSMAKPKNEGKTNSTTSEEQAIKECEALITKKLKEGYFDSIEEAQNEAVIMPMLAKVFEKEASKIDWTTAYVQPKLDGMRCLDTPNGKLSRKNTPIDTMDHIKVYRGTGGTKELIVDGELYAHGLSFQENMKLIKKLRPESVNVKYHVYDIVSDMPFKDRMSLLKGVVLKSDIEMQTSNMVIVPTYKVDNMADVKSYHTSFIAQGYEGTMVRWGNDGYKVNGRSSNLLKYKEFLDQVYKVVDVEPSDKNPNQANIICEGFKSSPDGDELGERFTFGCGMKFSHTEREKILNNKEKYIGKTAEVRYFELTDDGIPRFPVCYGFRLDK